MSTVHDLEVMLAEADAPKAVAEMTVATADVPEAVAENKADVPEAVAEMTAATTDVPEAVAENTVATADVPEAVAEMTVATADVPEAVAEMTVATADIPEAVAEMTVATVDVDIPQTVAEKTVAAVDVPEAVAELTVAAADIPETVAELAVAAADIPEAVAEMTAATTDVPEAVAELTATAAGIPEAVAELTVAAADVPVVASVEKPKYTTLRNDRAIVANMKLMMWENPPIPHDTIFYVGPQAQKISCHKFVLGVASKVFISMFENNQTSEFKLENVDAASFEIMRRYAYTREVPHRNSNDEVLISLLQIAYHYDVSDLWNYCSSVLKDRRGPYYAVLLYTVANSLNLNSLKEVACTRILGNFLNIVKTDDLFRLTEADLLELLSSDDLHIFSESDLFQHLVRWAKFQCEQLHIEESPENLRNALGQLIYQIQFSSMSISDLVSTVEPTKILSSEEFLMLLKYVAIPPNDRDRLAPLEGPFAPQSNRLPYNVRVVRIAHKENFIPFDDWNYSTSNVYSDGFEISNDVKRKLQLKSIGFMIKSTKAKGSTDNFCHVKVKVISGSLPDEQIEVANQQAKLPIADSKPTLVTFDKPMDVTKGQKYTILYSQSRGKLQYCYAREKSLESLAVPCVDTSNTVNLTFFKDCGIVAVLHFTLMDEV